MLKFKNKEEARVWAHFAGMALMNPQNHASNIADVLLEQYRERAQEQPPVRQETPPFCGDTHLDEDCNRATRRRRYLLELAAWDAAENSEKQDIVREAIRRVVK